MLSGEIGDASELVVEEHNGSLHMNQTKKKAIMEKLQRGKKKSNKQDAKTANKDSTSTSDW